MNNKLDKIIGLESDGNTYTDDSISNESLVMHMELLEDDIKVESEQFNLLLDTYVDYELACNDIATSQENGVIVSNESLELLGIDASNESFKDILDKSKKALKKLWDMIVKTFKALIKKIKELLGLNKKNIEKIEENNEKIEDIKSANKMLETNTSTDEIKTKLKVLKENNKKIRISTSEGGEDSDIKKVDLEKEITDYILKYTDTFSNQTGLYLLATQTLNPASSLTRLRANENDSKDCLEGSSRILKSMYKKLNKEKELSQKDCEAIVKEAHDEIYKVFKKSSLIITDDKYLKDYLVLDENPNDEVIVADLSSFLTTSIRYNEHGLSYKPVQFNAHKVKNSVNSLLKKSSKDWFANSKSTIEDMVKEYDKHEKNLKDYIKSIEKILKSYEEELMSMDNSARLKLKLEHDITPDEILGIPTKSLYISLFKEFGTKSLAGNSTMFKRIINQHKLLSHIQLDIMTKDFNFKANEILINKVKGTFKL